MTKTTADETLALLRTLQGALTARNWLTARTAADDLLQAREGIPHLIRLGFGESSVPPTKVLTRWYQPETKADWQWLQCLTDRTESLRWELQRAARQAARQAASIDTYQVDESGCEAETTVEVDESGLDPETV